MLSLIHVMFIPMATPGPEDHGDWRWLVSLLLWFLPFAAAYFWHLYHDHKHNHRLEKKLDEIAEILRRIAERP